MKRWWHLILGWLLLAAPAARAQLTYAYINGSATITGFSGSGAVVIPSSTNGLVVQAIGAGAFASDFGVTSITLPNTLTTIGANAFTYCTFPSLNIPASVTSIASSTFNNMSFFQAINVDASNTVYSSSNGVLFDKNQTILIAYPNYISNPNYTIPATVTQIGDYAFYFSEWLTNVVVPNGVTSIGTYSFEQSDLHGITIPASVTSIGEFAFTQAGPLSAINVDSNNPVYASVGGVLYNHSKTTLLTCPPGLNGSYTIPNGVTNIADYAFFYSSLTSIIFPRSVNFFGTASFYAASATGFYFSGNAPGAYQPPFGAQSTIAYYIPGYSGWGTNYGGLTAAYWPMANPTVLTFGTNSGVQSGRLGFNIFWATNRSVIVEVAAAPVSTNWTPVWTPVITNAMTNGLFYFTDPGWTNYQSRYYRILGQ